MAKQTHWIIGCDASNGVHNYSAIKYVDGVQSGKRKDYSIQSVRAQVSVGSMGLQNETDFDYWQWHDLKYTAGQTALEHAVGGVQPVAGRSRYGNEAQLFLVAVALHELGVKDGDTVELCLLAPPADATPETAQKYRDGIAFMGNKLEIAKNGKKPRTFKITDLTVFPETIAASYAAQYDDAGTFIPKHPLVNSVLLVDGGRVTLDSVVMRNGQIDKTTISTATDDTRGIRNLVLWPVERFIRDNLPSVFHNGAEELADRAIMNPGTNSNGEPVYRVHRMGEPPRNITSVVNQSIEQYQNEVLQVINTELTRTNAMRVMLIGGIEPLAGDAIRAGLRTSKPPKEVVTLRDYPHLKRVDATYLNSVGAMRILSRKQAKAVVSD